MIIGFYSFYDTLNENSQIQDLSHIINSDKIIGILSLNIIQSVMMASGVVIFWKRC